MGFWKIPPFWWGFFEMSYVSTCKLVLQYNYTGRNDVKLIRQRGRERERGREKHE